MLIWVPVQQVADATDGLDDVAVEVVVPDGGSLPESAPELEFYVPPFFPALEAVTAMAQMGRLKVVQTLTAGFDRVRPFVPPGAVLCNARGVHDASTSEPLPGRSAVGQRDHRRLLAAGRTVINTTPSHRDNQPQARISDSSRGGVQLSPCVGPSSIEA